MARLRVGDIPRGSGTLWLHKLSVDFDQWADLDVDGIIELQNQAVKRRVVQDALPSDALGQVSIFQFRYEPERSWIWGMNQAAGLDRRLNKSNSLSLATFMALAASKSLMALARS